MQLGGEDKISELLGERCQIVPCDGDSNALSFRQLQAEVGATTGVSVEAPAPGGLRGTFNFQTAGAPAGAAVPQPAVPATAPKPEVSAGLMNG